MEIRLQSPPPQGASHHLHGNPRSFRYLHFPGFSQNPFSVLHPALQSQPLRQETERDSSSVLASKEISPKKPTTQSQQHMKHSEPWNMHPLYFSLHASREEFVFHEWKRICVCASVFLSDVPEDWSKTSDYLLRCQSRPKLRPPLCDAS